MKNSSIYITAMLMIVGVSAEAAPIKVTFASTNVTTINGTVSYGPNASGYLIYDSEPVSGSSLYSFNGLPYEYSIHLDGLGDFTGTSTLLQVTDNDPLQDDIVQLVGNEDAVFQLGIAWFGSAATFSGTGIPDIPTLLGMSPNFNLFNKSTLQFEAVGSISSISVAPVPIPAAAWLFGSALLGLGAVKRRKA